MESSEERNERLKAMHIEASAEKQFCSNVETYMGPGFLSDPLIETSAATMMQESRRANKKSKASTHIAQAYVAPTIHSGSPETRFSPSFQGSINPEMTRPAHRGEQSYSSPHPSHQRPVYYSGIASHRSPARMGSPFPVHPGTTPGVWNRPEMIPPAHHVQQSYYPPHQRHERPVCYSGMGSPFPMHQGTTPGNWNRPGSMPNNGFPSNAGASTVSPDSGAYGPGVDHEQSRGHWPGTSPNSASGRGGSPSSGRGRGHWLGSSMSPCSGRSRERGRGRGRGPQPKNGTLGPERFYDKSMVEDPWLHLEPVIWKGLDTPDCSNSRLPESTSMKKERVSEAPNKTSSQPDSTLGPELFYDKSMIEDPWQDLEPVIWKGLDTPSCSNSRLPESTSMKKESVSEAPNKTSSQPSLAEYLAASFNESVNDAEGV